MWRWRFSATCRNRAEQVANRARQDVENPWTLFAARSVLLIRERKAPMSKPQLEDPVQGTRLQ